MNALSVVKGSELLDTFFGNERILVHGTPDFFVFQGVVKALNTAIRLGMMIAGAQMNERRTFDVPGKALRDHRRAVIGQELDAIGNGDAEVLRFPQRCVAGIDECLCIVSV